MELMKTRFDNVLLAWLLATVSGAQFSTFNSDTEGWTTTGTNGSYTMPPSGSGPVALVSGPTGLCIYTDDYFGETFFQAPSSFLGNRSAYFGTNFEFDTFVTYTDSQNYPTMIIMGAGNVGLWNVQPFPPVGAWLHKSIPLVGASFRKESWNGPQATDADVQAVLGNVTAILVLAEWNSGGDATYLDNVGFTTALNIVSGTVDLNDTVLPVAGHVVNVDFRNGGSLVYSTTATLGAGGSFQAYTPVFGIHTVVVSSSHWIARASAPITIGATPVTGLTFSLPNGDADESGEVDAADIDMVIFNFGDVLGDPGYVANADLDESGEVDAADIDVAIANFGAIDD